MLLRWRTVPPVCSDPFAYRWTELRCSLCINEGSQSSIHGFDLKTTASLCTDTRSTKEKNGDVKDCFSYNKQISTIAREVCTIIRKRPRWENTLLSDFSSGVLFDPNCIQEIIKSQNNALLSLRFFRWICSQDGFTPDSETCNGIFDILVRAKASKAAQTILSSTKFHPQPASLESFAQCLSEDGAAKECLDVISQMRSRGITPSLAVFNTALSCSLRVGRTDLFWDLYGEMMDIGFVGDEDTAGYLVRAFCKDSKLSEAYGLLHQVLEAGLSPDVIAFTKLISGFCKEGNYGKVSELLHLMIAKNRPPSIFTYQEIIHGLRINRMGIEGLRVFNDLKKKAYAPDRVMYTSVIDGLCKMNQIGQARKLWFEMIHNGFLPNEYTYNVLIDGYSKSGNLEEAQKLYKEMCDSGLKVSTINFNTLIHGLCLNRKMVDACSLFEEMVSKGSDADIITYNILIEGYCKHGKISEAMNFFHELLGKGLQPSTSSYTPLIKVLSGMGRMQEAIYLWNDMISRGLEPLICTRDYIITGFCKQGNLLEGMDWLAAMLSSNLKPRKRTFIKLIECLTLNDQVDDALLVLHSMFELRYSIEGPICHVLVQRLCKDNSNLSTESIEEILQRDGII